MARIRCRVSALTIGLPRSARDTVGWETPARWAISREVALPRMVISAGGEAVKGHHAMRCQGWACRRDGQAGRGLAAVGVTVVTLAAYGSSRFPVAAGRNSDRVGDGGNDKMVQS